MQELALQTEHPRGPVLGVAGDGVADRLQVHADLVGAARVQPQAQQRVRGERAIEREVGAGLARKVAADRHARAHGRVAPDRRLDRAAARARATLDQREVFALDLPRGERLLQQPVGLLGAGDHEQARGVAVEAVHDAGALRIAARGDAGEQLRERALAVPPRGVHHEAGGLVDDEQVLVFVGDREWPSAGSPPSVPRRSCLDLEALDASSRMQTPPVLWRRRRG